MRGADQLPFRTDLYQSAQEKGSDAPSGFNLPEDWLHHCFALPVKSLARFGFQLPFHLLHGGFRFDRNLFGYHSAIRFRQSMLLFSRRHVQFDAFDSLRNSL